MKISGNSSSSSNKTSNKPEGSIRIFIEIIILHGRDHPIPQFRHADILIPNIPPKFKAFKEIVDKSISAKALNGVPFNSDGIQVRLDGIQLFLIKDDESL